MARFKLLLLMIVVFIMATAAYSFGLSAVHHHNRYTFKGQPSVVDESAGSIPINGHLVHVCLESSLGEAKDGSHLVTVQNCGRQTVRLTIFKKALADDGKKTVFYVAKTALVAPCGFMQASFSGELTTTVRVAINHIPMSSMTLTMGHKVKKRAPSGIRA